MKRTYQHTRAHDRDELGEATGGGVIAIGAVATFALTFGATALMTYRRTEPEWNYCPRPDRAR